MPLTREMFDAGIVFVAAAAAAAALLMLATIRGPFRLARLPGSDILQLGAANLCAGLIAFAGTGDLQGASLGMAAGLIVGMTIKLALPRLTVAGALHLAASPLALLAAGPWLYLLLAEHGAPAWLLATTACGAVAGIPLLALDMAERLAREATLTHRDWRRPNEPLRAATTFPKVSIHVPTYAEPPAIVCATLDRLAALDYPDFEVIVCDNNTPDEGLWRPLERHCALLNQRSGGPRFRFFHVAPLAGAKAGALNFCLEQMAADTDLVAVADADYLAEPDFLARLTGFFDEPRIGYVQTPHDYREHEANAYLRGCYWEYMPSNKVDMPGVNEYGAAFTIGTMCLIRADALVRAGGWAEWCLTEDSEVSVRLRALGYQGIYLRETFGRGLIPPTFADYKKQRFRWTAGPMQQLRRHWRLFLPCLLGGSAKIGGWSKLLEVTRAIAPLQRLAGTVLGLVGAPAGIALIAGGTVPQIAIPNAGWAAAAIGVTAALIARWVRYRLSGCDGLTDMVRGELARLSLAYVQMVGGVAGLSGRTLAWRRTPKFDARRSGLRALRGTLPETAIGSAYLMVAVAALLLADRLGPHMALLIGAGALLASLGFFAAPLMALRSERQLGRAVARETGRIRASPLSA